MRSTGCVTPLEYPGVKLPADVIENLLESWPVACLVTQGAGGGVPVPIVFARAKGRLWSPVDGKPKSGAPGAQLARLRNVRRDSRVALLLDRYEQDWRQLWWLRVEGTARIADAGDASFEAAGTALRAKYPQYVRTPLYRGTPTLLCITAGRLRSWCAGAEAVELARRGDARR